MFEFIKKVFIGLLSALTIKYLGQPLACHSEKCTKCVSLNNWSCQARPALINTNSNETLFYSFIVSVNKGGGNCDTIDEHDFMDNFMLVIIRCCFR